MPKYIVNYTFSAERYGSMDVNTYSRSVVAGDAEEAIQTIKLSLAGSTELLTLQGRKWSILIHFVKLQEDNTDLYNELASSFNDFLKIIERESRGKDRKSPLYLQRASSDTLEKMRALMKPLGLVPKE